ncbi:hypothetical protein [Rubritalea sp.]|uniref:hypothetical protein n=1 Tax=Rubritalea sp. TaxID=2109375 RepID=UPI003EF62542
MIYPSLYCRFSLGFLIFLGISLNLSANNKGQIKGIVPLPKFEATTAPAKKYFGKISGKVDPAPAPIAGVWLESSSLSAPKTPKPIVLSQINYQFSNSLIIVPTGTYVTFPNNDPDYHNIYSLSKSKRFDLGRYKKDESPAPIIHFDKPGFIALNCEIHDHMKANIIVVNSPYYTVTNSSGAFSLKNIPQGNYTLHAQVDRNLSWKISIKVGINQITQIRFPN